MTYKRKLIEVALPLEAINSASAREKSIRHGHPSTLHLWWARRPLAACRAVLFASLVDDPSAHPDQFPTEEAQEAERQRLFRIIEELVKWENTTNEVVLGAARAEILRSCDGEPPSVLDPFCGGGSIPLEAQRLGLEAHASDLNPVAVLITKALIEIPPKFAGQPPVHPDAGRLKTDAWKGAQGLAEDVRYYGEWMRDEAERRIGHLYPRVTLPPEHGGGEATVIAWIWARIVRSPNPAWDGPMPLVRSFALSTKKGKETWVQPIVDRDNKGIRFEVRSGPGCPVGTVGRNGAVCLATGTPVPLSYIREEGKAGRISAQLMAIVGQGRKGRVYLPPDHRHGQLAAALVPPDDLPDTELPKQALGFRVQAYGMTKHRHLFTDRQLLALATWSDLVPEAQARILSDGLVAGLSDDGLPFENRGRGAVAYADAVAAYLGLAVSRLADANNSLCSWSSSRDQTRNLFARQAVPMVWDFVENNPFAAAAGDLGISIATVARAVALLPAKGTGTVLQRDAASFEPTPSMCATDPPYYDNIGYADLSDFFYVWIRRSLRHIFPSETSTLLTPKSQELIATPFRNDGDSSKADTYFEEGLGAAFRNARRAQLSGFPFTVYYGFKQSEEDADGGQASTGWETMLEGLIREGFSVNGTWPIRTERGSRSVSIGTNALASSIVLACRPRGENAPLATRRELLAALKLELPGALRKLQQGNIAPVDLAQAAIGPGMAVFSRYSMVVEADGSGMTVRTALGLINEVLDETLAEQESNFDADTRWALAWFEHYGVNSGPFGVAETLSKAKNTAISGLVRSGVLTSQGGKVRLLDRAELLVAWDPVADSRVTIWEVTQHMIQALQGGGEEKAAELLRRVGGLGETARELAYRLYVICERKKWAKEALAYNSLVVAWPEIARLAAGVPADALTQETLL